MKPDRRPANGGEQDAYTGWRNVLCYLDRPGVVKRIKQRTHRRDRRVMREQLRRGEQP